MTIRRRPYNHAEDYWLVDQFLIEHHRPGNADGNWLEPAWEYMHFHPALDSSNMGSFGVWEDDGRIVAVAHYEWRMGEGFFQFHPLYRHLMFDLLTYAEKHLSGTSEQDGRRFLCAYVNDNDDAFLSLVTSRGYERDLEGARPMYRFDIPERFPAMALPAGFRLVSLADDCDWRKVDRVLWRGFDHEGEPPATEADLDERRRMFDTPTARRDLKIAVAAPNGDYAALAGMFYEPNSQFAYLEPVATDPDYRRMGLGRAAVLEGIRRCAALGARVAYVGSDQEFYRAIGFTKVYDSECWTTYL